MRSIEELRKIVCKLIIAAVIAGAFLSAPAHAYETITSTDGVLQLQFQRWSMETQTTVGVLAAVKNTPTPTSPR
jgi:hypothetical protein